MDIVIFGASGGTGRQLIEQGLEKGYKLTAVVRNPAVFTIQHKNLTVLKAEISDLKQVEEAIKGKDIVISALGNKLSMQVLRKKNTTISEGIKNIIAAMKSQKVKRLLFIASFGVNEEIFLPEKIIIRLLLKNVFADIPAQEKLITESGLDWTIVHPARLVNGVKKSLYRANEQLRITPFSHISRADVADFLLKICIVLSYNKKIVTLSY